MYSMNRYIEVPEMLPEFDHGCFVISILPKIYYCIFHIYLYPRIHLTWSMGKKLQYIYSQVYIQFPSVFYTYVISYVLCIYKTSCYS